MNGGWDPTKSETGVERKTDKTTVEKGQIYAWHEWGKKIMPNTFFGSHFNDTLMFLDPSTSENGQPTIETDLIFMSMQRAEKPFSTQYDGFVGIAPYTDS